MRTLIIIALLSIAIPCLADPSVQLEWDANDPTPEGYRVFQREEGTTYDYNNPVWEGTATRTSQIELEPNKTYYWVARAFDGGLESENSNEVSSFRQINTIYNNGGTINIQ